MSQSASATDPSNANPAGKATIEFDDHSIRLFTIAGVIWGVVAMLVGVIAATQLNFWQMNGKFLETITFGAFQTEGLQYITFGRLRPLHTNAAIFAFVGNMMFAGIYYSTQRLCNTRTASDLLSKIHFWGWQLIIVAAAITLPMGFTRGKEYAELIWPINIAVALIWVVFSWNFLWTLKRRNEPSLYVAIWFYIATIVTVAMLYIVNHLSIPTSLTHSYTLFGGVQDALVQWWYGHNAVAFFLTTPILGIMYYFLPKAANRPVYSYRLSVVHFWSLVFLYIWAGPHHLLNTDLPRWLQMLGMLFSLMLWAPSWGGMLNGLLTLRGAWDKLRTDPVIKFFAVAVTFYGMATFEGPLLSIRAVNSLSHYSDWTIGHVHSGTLGWNGFMAAGLFYWLAPRLWRRKDKANSNDDGGGAGGSCAGLWSVPLANMHFWIGLVGILLYVSSMWVSGIMQGLMLNAIDPQTGTTLKYAGADGFLQTLNAIRPLMLMRAIGGLLYLIGFIMLVVNIFMTIRVGTPVNEKREVTLLHPEAQADKMSWKDTFVNDPVLYSIASFVFLCLWIFLPHWADFAALACCMGLAFMAVLAFKRAGRGWSHWYDRLSENYLPFTVLTLVAVATGGIVQILPTVTVNRASNVEERLQQLYTPLELAGRDIYVAEGCYNCHSQMIRTMVPDVMRYALGKGYSRIGESIYDHPFQWGSKRTGPDLAREGGQRPNSWHFRHMMDPRSTGTSTGEEESFKDALWGEKGSNMPPYPWLFDETVEFKDLPKKIAVQTQLGVPYPAMTSSEIMDKARVQADVIVSDLKTNGHYTEPNKKIVALIAYLQKLGAYDEVEPRKVDETPLKPRLPDANRRQKTTASR